MSPETAVAVALNRLLTSGKTQQSCHHWAQQSNTAASLAAACQLLEALLLEAQLLEAQLLATQSLE